MFAYINWPLFLPGVILLVASIDDLRSRKIHNHLILFMLPFVLLAVFLSHGVLVGSAGGFSASRGFEGLLAGGFSALLALLVGVPLTLGRIIGGGDLKLLVLMSLTLSWPDFFQILIYSLPWALLLGLVKIVLDKQLKEFFWNLIFLMRYRRIQGLKFHSIPFSVALFAAWLSFLTLQGLNY